MNTSSESTSGCAALTTFEYLLDELAAPDSVATHILNTVLIDGQETASWGDITASWMYHLDDGYNFVATHG
ncbi:hypothetical protein [Gulosibacter chungangensis]|uniref:Uncharacterized protein n=1 Tax=Gulosibacter chungangensis TaxID=979746 RepID=A0A7J5B8R5_9MICO|nr:hypothetical protein [Gulosibacter chungangensis]KAB1641711.1 hypothetical protein F8O05_12255 [Gulosibacter chungangensis]